MDRVNCFVEAAQGYRGGSKLNRLLRDLSEAEAPAMAGAVACPARREYARRLARTRH